jgi:hypothetical protein
MRLSGIDDTNGLIDPKFKRPAGDLSSLITGRQPTSPAEQQNAARQEGLAESDSSALSSIGQKVGKIDAEIAGTAGVRGADGSLEGAYESPRLSWRPVGLSHAAIVAV